MVTWKQVGEVLWFCCFLVFVFQGVCRFSKVSSISSVFSVFLGCSRVWVIFAGLPWGVNQPGSGGACVFFGVQFFHGF